ncbi:MAG TPA: hypothetical protein VMU40_17440 [Steroidobacteraceae bacterium]|nr:hypothetical protein [Steroidobacteraceae bacterium]
MKPLTRLSTLMRERIGPPAAPAEDERVLVLFKNRAELKKAYGELQEEVYRLKDRIKQQEGATARVQEMLGALEGRLGLAETAYPALVFYQLRALWQSGRAILEQFVTELANQQEERERRAFLAECNRRLFALRQSIDGRLRAAETQHVEAHEAVAQLVAARATLTRFWHYFKRRNLDRQLQTAQAAAQSADAALGETRAAAEQLNDAPVPDFPGLSLEARRAINLAAIAYAEVLCLRLIDTPLVALAKEASSRREVAEDYGGRQDCEVLIAGIASARSILQSKVNVAQDVKGRSERLKAIVRYRDASDATPQPESIAFGEGDALADQPLGGTAAARMPNVLAEDTWDLFRVLMR